MTPDQLLTAHRQLWRTAFSLPHIIKRILRGVFHLRPGAFLLSLAMNGFYGLKALRGNQPATAPGIVSAKPTTPGALNKEEKKCPSPTIGYQIPPNCA